MTIARRLGILALGVLIGGVATALATRASRDPESVLYRLRARMGEAPQNTSEADWLQRQYGSERHSQNYEEWILRDFFKDKKDGVFVDVGAADYQISSNTVFLERQLGWSGVAIDALESYKAGYTEHRPRTKFFALFVSDRSNDRARLFVGNAPGVSSSERAFSEAYGGVAKSVEMPTITLNDLLDAEGIARFDFLSMDIELAEPAALAGLDIQRFHPALAVVEAHPQVRQQILDYFTTNQYTVVGKYLRVDSDNIWFMPLGETVEPFPPEHQPEEWQK